LDSIKRSGGSLSFEPIPVDEFFAHYDTLVFDESSMIGKRDTYDKLIGRIPCRKYFVGDEAQLPPVNDLPAVNLARADVKLTEILRQGKDSGILAFAHGLHGGKVMLSADMAGFPDLTVVRDHHYKSIDAYLTEHQIVVWKNDERASINTRARLARGFDFLSQDHTHLPLPGETLMVDKNSQELRLLSGEILTVIEIMEYNFGLNPYLATVRCSDSRGNVRDVMISMTDMAYKTRLHPKDSETDDSRRRREADRKGLKVMFSYAITCHKAQGSEWDKVVYVGSMMPFSSRDWKSHWYTGCTRARNELVVASYHFTHEYDD
jgi:exodeoxyribonuclease-5